MALCGDGQPVRDAESAALADINIFVTGELAEEPQLNGGSSLSKVAARGTQDSGQIVKVSVSRRCQTVDIVNEVLRILRLEVNRTDYELVEVTLDCEGRIRRENHLGAEDTPLSIHRLWSRRTAGTVMDGMSGGCSFGLRRRDSGSKADATMAKRKNISSDDSSVSYYGHHGHGTGHPIHYRVKDYPDLCDLPELNESTLLSNLRSRFLAGNIYTYVGTILVAINPFRYYPIYNPKYVKQYQGRGRRSDLPPHIFAIADAAYTALNRRHFDQCIVISGESGSGKTESSNFLLHHLSALSRKMFSADSSIEQCILNAGPVLEVNDIYDILAVGSIILC